MRYGRGIGRGAGLLGLLALAAAAAGAADTRKDAQAPPETGWSDEAELGYVRWFFNRTLGGDPEDYSQCAREILRPRLGDYLVIGADTKLLDENLLIRMFLIWDLIGVYEERWSDEANKRVRTHHGPFTSQGYSLVIFPEISYNFGHGFELGGGALFMLGKDHSKFGDPATGGHLVWTRARLAF